MIRNSQLAIVTLTVAGIVALVVGDSNAGPKSAKKSRAPKAESKAGAGGDPKKWDAVYILNYVEHGEVCPMMEDDYKTVPVVEHGKRLQRFELGPSGSKAVVEHGKLSFDWRIYDFREGRMVGGRRHKKPKTIDLGNAVFGVNPDGTIDDTFNLPAVSTEVLGYEDIKSDMKAMLSNLGKLRVTGTAKIVADVDEGFGRRVEFVIESPDGADEKFKCGMKFFEKDLRTGDAEEAREQQARDRHARCKPKGGGCGANVDCCHGSCNTYANVCE